MVERGSRTPSIVLVLAFVALLVTPIAAGAASGLPATISLEPATAPAGSTVEVIGLDFPTGGEVDLQVTTTAGVVPLATVAADVGGYFRQAVTLPLDAPAGFWEIRATAADGSVAVSMLEAAPAPIDAVADAAPATAAGNSLSDIVVMLIFALVIAGVGGGTWYVWYMARMGEGQPGMSIGEDPIWSSGHSEIDPAFIAGVPPDDRTWGTARGKS